MPLEVYEARNAVDIAKARGAAQYAPDIFSKAQASLQMTENELSRNADKKQIISTAKQTVNSRRMRVHSPQSAVTVNA